MPITPNQLVQQVDLPTWEWLRFSPVAPTTGISCAAKADNMNFNPLTGRYIYYLLGTTNFWRYDTIADSYLQLASPGITPLTIGDMKYSGVMGYYGRVIAATANTIQTGIPYNGSPIGYRIRIISGRGAGQERVITGVSDPIVADWGSVSVASALNLTDSAKNWGGTGTTNNVNNWVGYVVRIVSGTGINQVRKILYNSATVLTIADPNIYAYDSWSVPLSPTAGTAGWTTPAAGANYQIESAVITVDTPWDVQPDSTSRYVIQTGGIYYASGASVANGGVTLQYYSPLEDIWYAKGSVSNMVPILGTDISIESVPENDTTWYTGIATSGTTTTLVDATASWTVNQWAGFELYIFTGTGRGQLVSVTSNTANTLTFPALSTAPDSTSRYSILGYDGGTFTSTEGRIVFDNTKSWTLNQWTNYAVRILSGTGAGQIRVIQSNGTNSLVLYDNWNVQPDNTSRYVIQVNTLDMYITVGGNAETFLYRLGDTDMLSHGRILDEGIVQVACAMLVDGGSTSTHEVYEQKPVAISALAGTTTITATTAQPHQFKTGQWVSVRGVTNAADTVNVTGKVQITSVPSTTTFTYIPFATGSGTYQFSENLTISGLNLPDASKYHTGSATGGASNTVTFVRAQPSNINGWYVYGTNIAPGAQVLSGAGTNTITLNIDNLGTPSGTIIFTKWPRPVTATYSAGGGLGLFTATMTAPIPGYVKGWLTSGTSIAVGAYVLGGEGTDTPQLAFQSTGTISGTISFGYPVNNLLPVTGTYVSGSGTSITLASATPTYINGWFASGTSLVNGTTVTGGQGTSAITLSAAAVGAPSGIITFYPPTQVPAMFYGVGGAPTLAATGLLATGIPMQLGVQNLNNGSIMTPISAVTTASAGTSKFLIARRDMIGESFVGQNLNYLSGVAVGTQATTTLVDGNAVWATATGSGGAAGATSFTINTIGSALHNGWFVSGTGIAPGTKVVSGGGTTTITVDTPLTGAVSGTVTFAAWSTALIGRRLRVISATGVNQDLAITAVTTATGTLTFGAATAPGANISSYTILPNIIPGAGSGMFMIYNSSISARRGQFLFRFRGGATAGVDKIDITTDQLIVQYITPITETLGSGTMYAYDQLDRLYFTKDVTQRIYYLDCNNLTLSGAGIFPYVAGTAGVGNKMEIFVTADGLKYLWVNRQQAQEHFRQLLFF